MSYWLYIQAVINLALVGACVYLYVGYRRVRSQGAWQQELAPLVDTLGELLIEIERMSSRGREAAVTPAPHSEAPKTEPVSKPVAATETVAKAPAQSASATQPEATEDASGQSPVEPVLALAAQGMPAEEIARRLGRPIGEVSLVLGLRAHGVALTA